MKNTIPVAFGVLAGLSVLGCATHKPAASADTVRQSANGGTILLAPGANPQAAVKRALVAMEAHCKGAYEVVETMKTATGQAVSSGTSTYVGWGVTVSDSSTSQVYGMSITYTCRKPVNSELNQIVASWVFLGLQCNTEKECGGFPCGRRDPTAKAGVCARTDGSLPFALEGEECFVKDDCAPSLKCYKSMSGGTCGR